MSQVKSDRSITLPAPGVLTAFAGVGLLCLYVKGYTFTGAVPRLGHFVLSSLLFMVGLRMSLFGERRKSASSTWNEWIPYRVALTREGWMYVVIMVTVFIGALLGRNNLLMLVFGLLAGPFVLNGYVIVTMLRGNRVDREAPPRVMFGEPFSVEVTLANRRRWLSSWMLVVHDHLENSQESLEGRILFSRVSPGAVRSGRYQARLMHRGRYRFGPILLATRFPLGLVERALVLKAPGEIIVHPRIGRLTSKWRRDEAVAEELVQQAQTRSGAYDDEFHRLREYRAGDNPRAIHWRTSARRNSLMVREYHQSRDTDLVILLDLYPSSHLPPGSEAFRERVELAIRFAATLCVDHCRHSRESQLFLGINGENADSWQGPAGPAAITPLLDHLALANPAATDRLSELVAETFRFRSPNGRRLLITTRETGPELPEALLQTQAEAVRWGGRLRIIEAESSQLAPFFVA